MESESEQTLTLQVSQDGAPDESVDQLTSSLISQLKDLDLDLIQKATGAHAPAGAKGDPITIGSILVGLSTAAVPSLIAFLQNWVGERRKVVIQAPNGAKIEFVPDKKLTIEEIMSLTQRLNRISSSK